MSVQTTQVKRTKRAKINARIGATAMQIAEDKGDKLAVKAAKYKRLWIALKNKIAQKYHQKARAKVYKSMTKHK